MRHRCAKPSKNLVKPSKKPSSHLVKKFIVLLGVHEPKVISVQTPHTENKEQDTTNKPKVNNVARVPVNASFLLIS